MRITLYMNQLHEIKAKSLLLLSLGALGVVYGDIGTSPLYAVNQIFFGHGNTALTRMNILGAISLIFWTITLLISIKYIILVLQADHEGKGGVFALYGLLERLRFKGKGLFIFLLIVAAGLLFGDGIITPAISVLSSTEGLANINNGLIPFIVPITLAILTALFFIQKKGTATVGILFAPIIIVWFVSIAIMGGNSIMHNPQILIALNPYYGLLFLVSHSFISILLTLGAAMLAITGGEAMYADIGHFGALPIRVSWFGIVYPSLILNYLGQGAYVLGQHPVYNNSIFFSMVPHAGLYAIVIIATIATIIASQALISGAFSLASQAISLKLFPFLKVIHTHTIQEGQIYVPFINWALYVGCVLLVLFFRTSNNLASAYGLAVSGVMVVTSFSMIQIARHYWRWHPLVIYAIFVPFIIIDTLFLTANSLKFLEGGYIPLGVGFLLFFIMTTWKWAKTQTNAALNAHPSITVKDLIQLKKTSQGYIPKTAIIMSPEAIVNPTDQVPTLNHLLLERYGLLPSTIIFLTVKQLGIPYANKKRFEIKNLYTGLNGAITSVILKFGFRENPNAKSALQTLAYHRHLNISSNPNDWYMHIVLVRATAEKLYSLLDKTRYYLFKFLAGNTATAETYFGLGSVRNISAEIFHVALHSTHVRHKANHHLENHLHLAHFPFLRWREKPHKSNLSMYRK